MADGQQVQRPVEERKRRTLALRVERTAGRKFLTALDIGRGQCPECARDFGEAEIREVARFERREPPVDAIVVRCRRHWNA